MEAVALVAYALHLALAMGLRAAIQIRRTGSSGIKGVSGRPGSAERCAATLAAQLAMGASWRVAYAARVGRFFPGVGDLRPQR